VCQVCHDAVAVDVDHIVPFDGVDDPKRTDWMNLMSICRACHNMKTRRQR
jgi:5-methylcytosine-specific restriction endonuclease McrA